LRNKSFLVIAAIALVAAAGVFLYLQTGRTGEIIATVNGEKIDISQFHKAIETIEEPVKSMFREDPAKLVDSIIMRALLIQEIKAQGFKPDRQIKDEDDLMDAFLEKRFSDTPKVAPEEIKAFYETHKDRLDGKTLEQMGPMIEQVLSQGKLEEQYNLYLEELRSKADIKINHEALKSIAATPPDSNTSEDFDRGLQSGRPMLVDFGSNSCLPCRQLRPVLKEIKAENADRMEVLVIDVYRYKDLAAKFKVQVIPTLVLFDASGKEIFRGQGFMPKEAIVEQMKKFQII